MANVFHAGDGNLHPLVSSTTRCRARQEAAEVLSGRILDLCIAHGGSITGEHGVGVDKSRYMAEMFSDDDLDTMQLVRCAFDPGGLSTRARSSPRRVCAASSGAGRLHPLVPPGRRSILMRHCWSRVLVARWPGPVVRAGGRPPATPSPGAARLVAAPTGAREASALLRFAAENAWPWSPSVAGARIGWGSPPRAATW